MTISSERAAIDVQAESKRPGWATTLGVACIIGILGLALLALGAFAPANAASIGAIVVVLAAAAICALLGACVYLFGKRAD